MKLTLEIPDEKFSIIENKALELGIDAKVLAEALINEQISSQNEEFKQVVDCVLDKNKELYKRLA